MLTISGEGKMADWGYLDYAPWYSHRSNIKSVMIVDSVATIGWYAFYDCDSLTTVTISDSVTTIGLSAFQYCKALASVTIPDSVITIGQEAFTGCSKLTAITVDENNPNYSSDSFGILFNKDKSMLVAAPGAIETYIIPASVTTIGWYAFSQCESLTMAVIPDSVTTIEGQAFVNCSSLVSVIIPASVITIGQWAFTGCSKLTAITVDENNPNYSSDGFGVLFDKNKTTLIQAPGAIETYTIPDSVTTIGRAAFSKCNSLTEVTIPDSVTTINDWVFSHCYDLTTIHFGGDAPTFGEDVFHYVTATAYYPAGNDTWTDEVMQDYGGDITWVPFDTAAIACNASTSTETSVTILYDPDAAETITAFLVLYDTDGRFMRTETVTEQSNADGIITLSISYTEEEYAEIGRIAAFVMDGDTMVPLCPCWDSTSV